jgi:5-methylcytosine-specific restriction endonuclease McrA
MSQLFHHPVRCKPYDRLEFVRLDGNKVALYRVAGLDKPERRALEALGDAFALVGGTCFYCGKTFKPQPLAIGVVHRDHVVPVCKGGTNHLHNLVIACDPCGSGKRADDIFDFRPSAAKRYQQALSDHLFLCMKAGATVVSPSSQLPRGPAAKAGP